MDSSDRLNAAIDPASAGPVAARRATSGGVRLSEALGVAPFIVFALMFLILPTLYLVVQAFLGPGGNFTFDNILGLGTQQVLDSFIASVKLSALTAALGAVIGLMISVVVIRGRLPASLRGFTMTFSGVASNFAGVPLAFAFLATLGRLGVLTVLLKTFGIDIYASGFNIVSFTGLTLTYLYFQVPLMVLIIAPAVDGLRREWTEAAASLGASPWQFWRHVGLPILWPNLLGTLSLLFANAFGAIATAYSLTGSALNIVPVLLYSQIRGDVLHNPGLGAALGLLMIVITGVSNLIYIVVRTRAERWLK